MIKRITYLDYLRALSIGGIIAIHVIDPFTAYTHTIAPSHPFIQIILASLFRFAVPMYVMISGALLLSRPISSLREFIQKRFFRLGVPLLIWSVIFGVWYYFSQPSFSWYDYAFRVVFFGQPFYLLFVLVGLYLITPFLQSWLAHLSTKQLFWLVCYVMLTTAAANTLENWLLAGSNILPHFSFTYYVYYVGYYVAGYWLYQQKKSLPTSLTWSILVGSLGLIIATTVILTSRYGSTPKAFIGYDYLSLPVMVMTFSVFLILKKLSPKPYPLITTLSTASFGMYFIHMVIIPYIPPSLPAGIAYLLAATGSFITTIVISRIPRVNQLLGCQT